MKPESWIEQLPEHTNGQAEPQTVIHRYDRGGRPVSISLTRNSRGYTWEITYGAETVLETLAVIREANAALHAEYGEREP